MTKKQELVNAIADKMSLTKKDSVEILDAVTTIIAETILSDGEITLPNVGKFTVKETAARTGRNPQTGETIEIAASKRVAFSVANSLKTAVKEL